MLYQEIIDHLNKKSGKDFRWRTKATQKHINARITEGFTLEDFKKVIDCKVAEWQGTAMEQYIRPETLFGTKFESYLNTAPAATPKMVKSPEELAQPIDLWSD